MSHHHPPPEQYNIASADVRVLALENLESGTHEFLNGTSERAGIVAIVRRSALRETLVGDSGSEGQGRSYMSPPESHFVHVVPNQPSGWLHVLGGITVERWSKVQRKTQKGIKHVRETFKVVP
jgi:hypothetical protein